MNLQKVATWIIPVHTISEANNQQHWTIKKQRRDEQKLKVWAISQEEKALLSLPLHIKLTRIGKRKLDSDNLPVSMKYIRDAIADYLIPFCPPGHADGNENLSWEYDQKIDKKYSVIAEFYKKIA
jgi:hypothetical protein